MDLTNDSVLLRQYAEDRSDEAFAALVRRHINLVYSVALRCVGATLRISENAAQKRLRRAMERCHRVVTPQVP
ncbi:MAG: hypothetical protein JWM16_5747 [Verrucomicrobiales bacterium]|nr:hypothetical protein [Verrucomicrobiales bacterium]